MEETTSDTVSECVICQVSYVDELCRKAHENGKRHKSNLKKRASTENNYPGIHVTGFLPNTQAEHVINHFQKCANITGFYDCLEKNYMFIYFKDEQTVQRILNKSQYLNNKRLRVKRKLAPAVIEATVAPPIEDIIDITMDTLSSKGNFNEQMMYIISQVRLAPEQVQNMANVCIDIENDLGQVFPGCRAMPFGSMVTGLGTKGSDVDCYIDFSENYLPGETDEERQRLQIQYIKKAKGILYRYRNTYCNVIAIPQASTPIIKFRHIPTNTNCDINFKDCIGVLNSDLIRYLISLDKRLLPMFIFLKYLMRVLLISGQCKFTNYAWTMMAFFYLQQPPHRIIPTIRSLQNDPEFDNYQDDWNCGFAKMNLPESDDKQTLPVLLEGFFKFYATFDKSLMICPYIGRAIPKSAFDNVATIPEEFEIYKSNLANGKIKIKTDTLICVQDPFKHYHNVTRNVNEATLLSFQTLCEAASAICEKANKNNSYDTLLRDILQISVHTNQKSKTSAIKLPLVKKYIDEFKQSGYEAIETMVKDFLKVVFGEIIPCKMKELPKENNKVTLYYEGNYLIWVKRKRFLNETADLENLLLKDAKISNLMVAFPEAKDNSKLRPGPTQRKGVVYTQCVEFFRRNVNDWYRCFTLLEGDSIAVNTKAVIEYTPTCSGSTDTSKCLKRQSDVEKSTSSSSIASESVEKVLNTSPPLKVSKLIVDAEVADSTT